MSKLFPVVPLIAGTAVLVVVPPRRRRGTANYTYCPDGNTLAGGGTGTTMARTHCPEPCGEPVKVNRNGHSLGYCSGHWPRRWSCDHHNYRPCPCMKEGK